MGDKSPRNNSKAKKQQANKKSRVIEQQAPPSLVKPKVG